MSRSKRKSGSAAGAEPDDSQVNEQIGSPPDGADGEPSGVGKENGAVSEQYRSQNMKPRLRGPGPVYVTVGIAISSEVLGVLTEQPTRGRMTKWLSATNYMLKAAYRDVRVLKCKDVTKELLS